MDDSEQAWSEVYAVLPDGWTVMRPVWRDDDRMWAVYARELTGAQRDHDPWLEAYGESQTNALLGLAQQLRERAP